MATSSAGAVGRAGDAPEGGRIALPGRLRRGVTLVELLVVIGIVAVLIAILLPVLARAREQANRVKCAANLRSIGQALTMYTQQYGWYPGAGANYRGSAAGGGGYGFAVWPARLRPFLGGDPGVFLCPSRDDRCAWRKDRTPLYGEDRATDFESPFGYETGETMIGNSTPFSYGYNGGGTVGSTISSATGMNMGLGCALNTTWHGFVTGAMVKAGRVRKASEMLAITDGNADGMQDFQVWPWLATWGPPANIHGGGANVLFCDGHVQWSLQRDLVLPEQTADGGEQQRRERNRIARMWNNDNQPGFGY